MSSDSPSSPTSLSLRMKILLAAVACVTVAVLGGTFSLLPRKPAGEPSLVTQHTNPSDGIAKTLAVAAVDSPNREGNKRDVIHKRRSGHNAPELSQRVNSEDKHPSPQGEEDRDLKDGDRDVRTGDRDLRGKDRELRDGDRDRYMPVPGGETDDLDLLEEEWNNRLTYPTGLFDPVWVRLAAAQDALIPRGIPAGVQAINLKQTSSTLALNPGGFTALGPQPLQMNGCSGCFNYGLTEGRVNDIAVDPTTTTNGSIIAYLGTVGGGVWKTTNCCGSTTSWTPVTDDPLLATISIDTLTLDPSNHNTIYAGTGDLNYGSFSMGSQGILKSTDAGATWTLLGADVFGPALPLPAGQFPQYQAVGKVRVDPRNSNNVVAGTKTGLYFSYDGGTNWTGPCTTNNFSTMRQDITGLALNDMGGSTRIIAAVGVRGFATTVQFNLNQNGANGIYKGTMPGGGCPTDFVPITTNANGWTGLNATSGIARVNTTTGNQVGRIDIAVAPSNANYIYAQVQSITPNSNGGCGNAAGCQLAAYRTTDGGTTWTQIPGSTGASLTDCEGGAGDYPQNWYDQGVAVDPNNPNRVFFDTFEVWFWDGSNPVTSALPWNDTTCGYGTTNNGVHVDQHALAFVPGSSSILLAGNDGGVHGTTNADLTSAAVDPTWFNMDGGLNTIEFYSGDISGNFATSPTPQANGGAQDNGSMSVTFAGSPTGPVQWQSGRGGDGFYARLDPVGTGTSLRFWQGNNSGSLGRCTSNCTASGASWSTRSGGWGSEQQSFILPYDLFHGGIPGGDDCGPAGPTTGCGHLIAGTTRVWETITGATATNTWYITNNPSGPANGPNLTKGTLGNRSFINQVKYSPKYQSVAIVGTNDGNVQIGFNLGTGTANQANWVNVTGGNTVLPNRPVLGIALDPSVSAANVPVGYAAVGGFNANTPATPGHVFQVVCTADCGSFTWSDKSGNLPDIPVDSIINNPNFPQQVFAGTDWGLYYTDDITTASPTWFRFDSGLPHSMIWDMQIDRGSTTLSVWTRGRGAYVWPLPSGPITPCTATNVASATGSTVLASSSHASGNFPALSAINGDRTGNTWGSSTGGWNDNTRNAYPDILEIDFATTESINQINVFTLQNNWTTAGEPTIDTPATGEGILDFIVQHCSAGCETATPTWATVPGGNVTGNDKAMRVFNFPPVTTSKIRVVVNNSRNNWSRIVEVEAYRDCP